MIAQEYLSEAEVELWKRLNAEPDFANSMHAASLSLPPPNLSCAHPCARPCAALVSQSHSVGQHRSQPFYSGIKRQPRDHVDERKRLCVSPPPEASTGMRMASCDEPVSPRWDALKRELDAFHLETLKLLRRGTELSERLVAHSSTKQGVTEANGLIRSLLQKLRGEVPKSETSEKGPKPNSDPDQVMGNHRRNHRGSQTELLKRWFYEHILEPYPSYAEKMQLAQETNLEIHQIDYWFTNQRKRHWNTHTSKAAKK